MSHGHRPVPGPGRLGLREARGHQHEWRQGPPGKKADQVRVALVRGGTHPYFQPRKDAGVAEGKKLGVADVTFNETAGSGQTPVPEAFWAEAETIVQGVL